ncbi:uncharacterized protein N7484_007502 [Penicillium longicatenatum]|uniref:uncharacterized protein n=1 Tax=Penicillium longicatenatum TaxID=1561947 RepID=UPI00254907B9|nr:uncharacterized protein N7484_007502 [Penicillium longicatenatum]KAJ5639640.1 hypothetical protein N7484_007502 [Penicillium longicatenatum]
MALGDCHCTGELDMLHEDPNRSQTTICLPSPSPAKQASTYLPKAGPKALEESNQDPFYLEKSLAATPNFDQYTPTIRDDRFSGDNSDYYTLSLTNGRDLPDHQQDTSQYTGPDRSTLAQIQLENSLRFHRYTSSTEEHRPLHSSQESFSSVQSDATVPDLTPSSSFSSTYSSPSCPDAVLKATEKLYHHAHQIQIEPRRAYNEQASTPPKYSLPPPPPVAALTPVTRPTTPAEPSNDSTSTITMKYETSSMSSSSRRRQKAHPTLPNLSNASSSMSSRRKQSSPGTRPPLDPSMISPPSLINPVTMEPHATHFDQALFIPANDGASPIPSPVASSPPISRQWTATSMERPSISTMDAYCEQSVWESDSENESISNKSLSRKPIDTLRKVRSRAKLRAAKSQPRLRQAVLDDHTQERFPCMPDDAVGELITDGFRGASLDRPSTGRPSISRPSTSRDGTRGHPLQTLRLVAPSSVSLIKPRSQHNSLHDSANESEMDWTAAAAMQAQYRRRQRSDTPEFVKPEKEQLTSMCYEQHSPAPIQDPTEQKPFFRRILDSLRSLNCARPMKSNTTTTI